jgi:hypothetical protein
MERLSSLDRVGLSRLVRAAKPHGQAVGVLVSLTIVMCRNLIFSGEFPGGWDVASITYPIAYFARIDSYFSLWEESGAGYVTPMSLFHLLSYVADVLGDPALVSRAVLVLTILAAALLMYLYTFAVTRRVLASLAAGIIFSTSPWLAANTAGGHGFLIIAYAVTPLLFLLLERGLEKATVLRVLSLGLLLSLLPSLRLDPVAYILPFVLLFAIWYVVKAGGLWKRVAINATRLLVPAVLLAGLASAYVWLPLLETGTAHATLRFGLEQIIGATPDFWSSLKGQGLIYSYLFWLGGTSYHTHQFLPPLVYGAVLLLCPALAFTQVRLRDDRRVSFFLLAAVLSVFLAKGPLPPLGEVYVFVWRYVPFVDRLHVPNRWLMITWLAYAFLAGLTLDSIYRASKRALQALSHHVLCRAAPGAAVALLLLGCTVGVSYVFTDGYQSSQTPEEELAPHRWLGENGEPGRFLGVPYEGNRWFTPGGWIELDLGFTGGMFSGRPSLDEPAFQGYASDFSEFIEELIHKRADTLAKIVGAYDVRYVVVQGYSSNARPRHYILYSDVSPITIVQAYQEHDYFGGLEGLRAVFEGPEPRYTMLVGPALERDLTFEDEGPRLWPLEPLRKSVVYDNAYWVPRAFVPQKRMLVVSGLDSLETIAEWEEFRFQDWDVRFASRTLDELGHEGLIEALRRSDLVLLSNSELLDLAMMIGDSTRADLANLAGDPEASWSLQTFPLYCTEQPGVLWTTDNHAQAMLPIDVEGSAEGQEYELWARVFYSQRASLIHFELDGREVGSLLPRAGDELGFRWEKVGVVQGLTAGRHKVSMTALATSEPFRTLVDEVALARTGAVDEAGELLASIIEESQTEVVSLRDVSSLWFSSTSSTELSRYEQFLLPLEHPEEVGVRRALYGGQAESPRFLAGGRFLVREGKPASGYTPLLQLEFEEPQDWLHSTYLHLDFKGVGSGEEVRLRIDFGDSGSAVYSFEDLSPQWGSVVIPLFDPAATEGTVRWDQVASLTIGVGTAEVQDGVGLGTIAVVRDSLSLEHLSGAVGMKTFLLSPTDPTPASVAELLSAPEDRPAQILESEQVSPWLRRFRIAAEAPYTLIVSNTYHPLWRVSVDGREIWPEPSYYFVSAYSIDEIGEYDLTLEFVGQRYQWYAFALSGLVYGAALAAVAFCLVRGWRKDQQAAEAPDARYDASGASDDC